MSKKLSLYSILLVLGSSLILAGCAPLLVAGGAVGGYAIAKNASDDSSSTKKK